MKCNNCNNSNSKVYNKMSAKAVIELAAPPTWGASVTPVVLAAALSYAFNGAFSPLLFYSLLITSVCLQCAVNTLNDYADFVKGTDTEENSDDPNDASLIYNKVNPRAALITGAAFIAAAFIGGLYAIITAGWQLIIFGAAGVLILVLYSFGKKPISYLPLGEIVSGFFMGGLITLACFYAFTGELRWDVLLYSLPAVISIGMIMYTNNTCDIERDSASGRKTFPSVIGRKRARTLHFIITALNVAIMLIITYRSFPGGLFIAPLLIVPVVFTEYNVVKYGLTPDTRMASMRGTVAVHWRSNLLYTAMICVGTII